MKTSVSDTHKFGIFPKGIVHGFGQKFEILLRFRFMKEMWLFLIYFLPKRGLESTMKSKHNSKQISLQIVTPSAEAH